MANIPKGVGIGGGILFAVGAIMCWFGFPALINSQLAKSLNLNKDSDVRKMWVKFPDPIDFKIYMFNITNPQSIQQGGIPVVREIGPFFYDEYKEKTALKDREKDDTVEYNPKVTWFFNKEKSAPLTGDEMVTVPYIPILAAVLVLEKQKPGMLPLFNKAIKSLYRNPETLFLTAPARDILFDGVVINCTVTDFAAKAVCTAMKQDSGGLERISEDIFKFSFFGAKNGSVDPNRFRVRRGVLNVTQVGAMVELNGRRKLDKWSGEPCNSIVGTDSTIFPPFMTPDKTVAFSHDLCRSVAAIYERPSSYKDVSGYRYTASLGDMSTDPDLKCFCPTEDTCLKKGAFDLTPCTGAPVVLTLPHMYDTHEEYQRTIIGQSPQQEKHEIYLEVEPLTGTPLTVRRRLQFNMFLHKAAKIDLMKEVPDALLPIFWISEGIDLEDKYLDVLKNTLFRMMKIMTGMSGAAMGAGAAMAAGGIFMYFKKRSTDAVTTSLPKNGPTTVSTVNLPPVGNDNNNTDHAQPFYH